MTIKRVRLNEKVHEKLLYIKKETQAKSINDVIELLLQIYDEFYTKDMALNVSNKKIFLKYSNGKLVEIQIEK